MILIIAPIYVPNIKQDCTHALVQPLSKPETMSSLPAPCERYGNTEVNWLAQGLTAGRWHRQGSVHICAVAKRCLKHPDQAASEFTNLASSHLRSLPHPRLPLLSPGRWQAHTDTGYPPTFSLCGTWWGFYETPPWAVFQIYLIHPSCSEAICFFILDRCNEILDTKKCFY